MDIILDFDGTCVEHKYPLIGKHNPHSEVVLNKLKMAGHKIILNTYRADINISKLNSAINYVQLKMDIELDGYLKAKVEPPIFNLEKYIESGKIFIDDIAMGIPLHPAERMVNWYELDKLFIEHKLY